MIQRFELQGSMLNLEFGMQVPGCLVQERAVAVVYISNQVSRKSRFRGAHWPDVEVMHLGYVRKAGEILSHLGHLNAKRHGVEGEINRIAQQAPSAEGNNSGNHETYDWVDPKPARRDNKKTGDDNT